MLVCLPLNIVLLRKHMRLYETDCQKLCYTKEEVSCSEVTQNAGACVSRYDQRA